MTAKIDIYTVDYCPYCKNAVAFLDENKIPYTRHRIDSNEDEMRKMLGKKYSIDGEITVPQIVVDGRCIGGYSDMMELHQQGKFPGRI